ncbi:MAG: SCO family protein [Gammaproteobacteria bacterium]
MTSKVSLTNDQLKDLGLYLIEPARELGEFKLIDSFNNEFVPDDFKGRWNALFFGFTFCPDICPITMGMLSRIEKELGLVAEEKIKVFLVSVDPDRDTPEQLKIYLENFNDKFVGLTGGIDQIYNFATRVNAPFSPVINSEDPNYTVDHYGSIVVINPEGKYAGFFRTPHEQEKVKLGLLELINKQL